MMETIFNIYLFMSLYNIPKCEIVNENYIFILDQIETILKAATGF